MKSNSNSKAFPKCFKSRDGEVGWEGRRRHVQDHVITVSCAFKVSIPDGKTMEQGGGQIWFRKSKDLFNHEWILFSPNGKVKYSHFVLLPRPLGSLQLSMGQKALRETNIQDGRAVRKMFLSAYGGVEYRRWVCGSYSKGRGLVTCNTYREISNNDFRVICSKREGERFQKSWQ